MKKAVLFLACMALAAALLTGCSGSAEALTPQSYTAQGAQIQGILLDVRDSRIEVSLSRDGQVHIDYLENSKETYEIAVSEDQVLSMTSVSNKQWTDYIGGAAARGRTISLQIPDALLSTLELSTTNEDISLPALSVTGGVSLCANGGNIAFEGLDAGGPISLWVKNGDISGQITGSYDDYTISCEVKKGETSLPAQKEGGTKALEVSANNGDVQIEFTGKTIPQA